MSDPFPPPSLGYVYPRVLLMAIAVCNCHVYGVEIDEGAVSKTCHNQV